ncbi:MAG: aa3-type cytochrome c oxidase subunit IV [Rhodobacteraceae bacterium]|nr:aa3-type cytochrome c oxidase subunit IV [Paracoccaceae bacterium]
MAEYEPGKMDISEQSAGYDAFTRFVFRISVLIAVVLLMMWLFLT